MMRKALAAPLRNAKIVAIPGQDRATRLSPKYSRSLVTTIGETSHTLHSLHKKYVIELNSRFVTGLHLKH